MVKVIGTAVESIPPKHLVLTWAAPSDAADQTKHSRVTFEIEPMFGAVRLTVVHDELEPGSETLRGITQGWTAILSSLKTLLETGQPMRERHADGVGRSANLGEAQWVHKCCISLCLRGAGQRSIYRSSVFSEKKWV